MQTLEKVQIHKTIEKIMIVKLIEIAEDFVEVRQYCYNNYFF